MPVYEVSAYASIRWVVRANSEEEAIEAANDALIGHIEDQLQTDSSDAMELAEWDDLDEDLVGEPQEGDGAVWVDASTLAVEVRMA